MNVWCFATTKLHVRATITSQVVKYVSWIDGTNEKKPDDFVQDETTFYFGKWKREVGTYQYLNQFTSRNYFKYLRPCK